MLSLPVTTGAETKQERKARLKAERALARPKQLFCDSLQFLQNLPKPVTKESLIKFGNLKQFNGIAFLMNKATGQLWFMATRAIKVHTDFKSYFIAYSYEPESSFTKTQEFLGLPIVVEDNADIETYELGQGVYELNINQLGGLEGLARP